MHTKSEWATMTKDEYLVEMQSTNRLERLSYDVQHVIPHIRGCNKVCELGAAHGMMSIILDSIFHFDEITLIDINEQLSFLSLISTPLNFNGYVGDIESINLKDKYDCVVCFDTIQYLDSKFEWLGKINTNKVILSVPIEVEKSTDYTSNFARYYDFCKGERLYPSKFNFGEQGNQPYWLFVLSGRKVL